MKSTNSGGTIRCRSVLPLLLTGISKVTAGVVSSVPGSGFGAQRPVRMYPGFERPAGDAARKRTLRFRQVSNKLAGILSKEGRHILLTNPFEHSCREKEKPRRRQQSSDFVVWLEAGRGQRLGMPPPLPNRQVGWRPLPPIGVEDTR